MGIRAKISEGMNYGNDREEGHEGNKATWRQRKGNKKLKCISDRHPYAVTCVSLWDDGCSIGGTKDSANSPFLILSTHILNTITTKFTLPTHTTLTP